MVLPYAAISNSGLEEITMQPVEKCSFCGSTSFTKLFEVSIMNMGTNVVRCRKCGLAFLNPRPGQEEIKTIYAGEYFADRINPQKLLSQELSSSGLIKKLRMYLPEKGRVLDIGAATGAYLAAFKNAGWDVFGVEISDFARESAKTTYGITTIYPNLETASFASDYFDFIYMVHVIEHFPEHISLLKEVNRVLKPGGILFIATPNFGSPAAAKMKSEWPSLKPDQHLTFFTPKTLKMVLIHSDFKIVKCDTMQSVIETPHLEKLFGKTKTGYLSKIANKFFPGIKSSIRNIIGKIYPGDSIEIVAKKIT